MKLYVHFEDDPPMTKIFKTDDGAGARVADLIAEFAAAYNAKHGSMRLMKTEGMTVENSRGKAVEAGRKVARSFAEGEDVFVRLSSASAGLVAQEGPPEAKKAKNEKIEEPVGGKRGERDEEGVGVDPNGPLVRGMVERGRELEASQKFRSASGCYQQGLALAPGSRDAVVALMRLWLTVRRPESALEWAKKAVGRHSKDAEVLSVAAQAHAACGEHEQAISLFEEATRVAKQKNDAKIDLKQLQLGTARSLYAMGGHHQDHAAKIVMNVVGPDQTHFDGLLEYAKIAYDRGLLTDALHVLLRLVIKEEGREHREVKLYLAKCMKDQEGVDVVVGEVKDGKGAASAMGFIAARIKDNGAVPSALALYRRALELDPTNSSYALNYVHTLELQQGYDIAANFARDFCRTCPTRLGGSLELFEVVKELEGMKPRAGKDQLSWLLDDGWTPGPPEAEGDEVEEIVQKVEYDEAQLDLLALVFTTVKILFTGGALSRVSHLIPLVECARVASQKELHTTLIRNEAAYFGCVNQIMKQHPPPGVQESVSSQPLFLCGDSHCLSGAWQHVTLRGERRVLVPQLVTGCKIWHLREESNFYPKIGFLNTMANLPDNSQVILMFGEIDCREGLVLAVEKCKYDTDAEAISTVVNIYIRVIQSLIKDRGFEIFVHPPAPVLDVTRYMVKSLTRALKRAVGKACKQPSLSGKLHWLDFFDKLLSEDGSKLHPDLEFDGTHMSPHYVQHLNGALEKV